MATVTIEISDFAKEFVDREVASGHFKDASAAFQSALDQLMRTKWKDDADLKIDQALDEHDRGEITPWKFGDCERKGREYLMERRAREARS